jgi:CBS domain-containing protein
MNVAEVMVREVAHCSPEANLSTAIKILKEAVCGILPVVSQDRVVGVVTDRDICLALATGDRRPSDITVRETMTTKVHTVVPEATLAVAMAKMRGQQLRRLPVVDDKGHLVGIVSASDIVWYADDRASTWEVSFRDMIEVMQATARRRTLKRPR